MDQLNLTLGLFGLVVLVLGVSAEVVRNYISAEPVVALVLGFLLGPVVAGVVTPETWQIDYRAVLEQGARLTLAVALMEIGISLHAGALRKLRRSLVLRLGVILPAMWIVGSVLVLAVLDLPFWPAVLIGAAIAATDPIIASTIVSGKIARSNLPEPLRNALSAESAANDGLVYVMAMLPILFLTRPETVWSEWLLNSVLLGVAVAAAIGAAFGWAAGRVTRWARAEEDFTDPALLVLTTSLALVVLALVRAIHSDGILAVFVAAIVFDRQIKQADQEEGRIRNVVNRFLMLPIFLLLGATLPVAEWLKLGWPAILLIALVLLVRRLPLFLLLRGASDKVRDFRSAAFTGWFGPIGVAALYYILLGTSKTGDERVWIIGSLLIAASVLAHGITATPFTRWYGRASGFAGRGDDDASEDA